MLYKIKSPYWRAAFWAAVIVIPTYLFAAYVFSHIDLGFLFSNESHRLLSTAVIVYLPQMPGLLINALRAVIFSTRGSDGADAMDLYVPAFSWMFYFIILLGIFLWRQRRAAMKGALGK
jgi:hypothetical protein